MYEFRHIGFPDLMMSSKPSFDLNAATSAAESSLGGKHNGHLASVEHLALLLTRTLSVNDFISHASVSWFSWVLLRFDIHLF